jgi:LacI family repressor for deo operon, udp, cdd, tsx, nupC, and nupG
MDRQIPTIKEMARRLNVSASTISRALSDHPRIGLKTKEKVRKLAHELGYEPNSQAIFFKKQKTFVIGVILPSIREEFFSQAISGIEATTIQSKYTILFGQSYDDYNREVIVAETMKRQRVDGLIISLSKETNRLSHLEAFKKINIPVVYFDRVPASEKNHKVFCNMKKGTIEMVNWLFAKSIRRIALINGPQALFASKERLAGYIEGMAKHKLKVDMQLVEETDFSSGSTYRAVTKLLALKKRPEAIISFNDYVHMDAVKAALQQRIKVNKEMLFASYSNLNITGYTSHPPAASVEQYPYEQGKIAAEILFKILNTPQDAPESYIKHQIDPILITP